MSGQPNDPNFLAWINFDVTGIQIFEPAGIPPAGIAPSHIVPPNGHLTLRVSFTGGGFIWNWLVGKTYQAHFVAAGIAVPSIDWPVVTGFLVANQTTYQVDLDLPTGIAQVGTYFVYCMVTFPDCNHMNGVTDAPALLSIAL